MEVLESSVRPRAPRDLTIERRTRRCRPAPLSGSGHVSAEGSGTGRDRVDANGPGQVSHDSIPMPSSVVASLRSHSEKQAKERALAQDMWRESELVFTSTVGTPVHPRNDYRSFQRIERRRASGGSACTT